jgi:transcriptional regulator with XRE-family HTH domain
LTPKQLKERRHALGLTQKQAASAFGVTSRTYQNWEMGVTRKLPSLLEAGLRELEAAT